tara:strand:+ start:1330 stop:1527 length:198 start_codon:yes stop_codon:yes gene_type:complete
MIRLKNLRVEIKETDNRDIYTTDVILENNTVVEINPINLFENMILNRDNEELELMFNKLIKKLKE